MNHVVIGSVLPFVVGLIVYITRDASRRLMIVWPVCMVAGAFYALIPDLPRVLGMHELYMSLSRDPRCNIFLWHTSIDLTENDSLMFMCLFLTECLVLQVCALRLIPSQKATPS